MSWRSSKPVPKPLSRTKISMKDWKSFKKNFQEYIDSFYFSPESNRQKHVLSETDKVTQLLNAIGKEMEEVYKTFLFEGSSGEKTLAKVLDKFEDYCNNPVLETFLFSTRRQQPGETFDAFLADIRQQVEYCDFGELKDRMIISQIMVGVSDKMLHDQLASTKGLSLDAIIQFCNLAETYRNKCTKDVKMVENESP